MDVERTIQFLLEQAAKIDASMQASVERHARAEARMDRNDAQIQALGEQIQALGERIQSQSEQIQSHSEQIQSLTERQNALTRLAGQQQTQFDALLTAVGALVESDRTRAQDLQILADAQHRLFEAERRTDERLESLRTQDFQMLADAQRQLSEAERRTDERLDSLAAGLAESDRTRTRDFQMLADAQRRNEERFESLMRMFEQWLRRGGNGSRAD